MLFRSRAFGREKTEEERFDEANKKLPLGTRRELLERVKKEIKLPAFFE